ncbi:MAG: U32 family peptidase [Candidatus Omnitrophica bacterium]|nr:U32 family peptidase [Candidatus Omnitrophota bacterium]
MEYKKKGSDPKKWGLTPFIELVAPAGDWPSLYAAMEAGTNSVYFGVKELNMRHEATNFDLLEIKKIVEELHTKGCKGYLTVNTLIMEGEQAKLKRIFKQASAAKVDAVILWDAAALSMAKEYGLAVHLSTQASVANIDAVSFYADQGVKRIVLARECTLKDIIDIAKEIQKRKMACALEVFIHGAMCVSISGRCFLSELSFDKSANRGECLQPCRREFYIRDVEEERAPVSDDDVPSKTRGEDEAEYILGKDYVLSPKDLCTMDFIDELMESGVAAFKIEGRMRSPEYIRVVVGAYRKAMDAFAQGKLTVKLKSELKKELATVYNRGFSSGFYFGTPTNKDISKGLGHTHEKVYLGEVKKFYKNLLVADIRVRNGVLKKGDTLLFIGRSTPALEAQAGEMQANHIFVDVAPKGTAVGVKLPFIVRPKDKVFLWKEK